MSNIPMELVADDDIDTETLQAQIDLSMSFAHDLVSSWIKPAHRANLSSSTFDAQKLLDEQLRRPPRLGVGAPIPETSSTVREAARLKHQLVGQGKKRLREDEDVAQKLRASSDDEEDSRGGAIKKKAKLDPFAGGRGKKKKKKEIAALETGLLTPQLTPQPVPITSEIASASPDKRQTPDTQRVSSGSTSPTLAHKAINGERLSLLKAKNKKHHKKSRDALVHMVPSFGPSPTPHSILPTPAPSLLGEASAPQTPDVLVAEPEQMSLGTPLARPTFLMPENSKSTPVIDSIADSTPRLQAKTPNAGALLLTLPLLNLDGPPVEVNAQAGDDDISSSPKKKRRKRKKKKNLGNVQAGNG